MFTLLGGLIDTDLVLNAKQSPYRLMSNLLVPEGIELRIEPGTVVDADQGTRIQIAGSLHIVGELEMPVLLQWYGPDSPTRGRSALDGLEILASAGDNVDISHMTLIRGRLLNDGANLLVRNSSFIGASIVSINGGTPVIETSSFVRGTIQIWNWIGPLIISQNVIEPPAGDIGVMLWSAGRSSADLTGNTIIGGGDAIQIHPCGDDDFTLNGNRVSAANTALFIGFCRTRPLISRISLSGNDFVGSKIAHLITSEYLSTDVIATNNWWGSTDELTISQLIFDRDDDLTLPVVHWEPYLLESAFR